MNTNNKASSLLTSVEIANLWNSYVFESMVHHIFSYFINTTQDNEVKSFVEYCIVASRLHIHNYIAVFKKEKLPTPRGTTSEDINVNAPKLFSDAFHITYMKNMAKFALTNFAITYSECSTPAMRILFKEHLDRLEEVDRIATELMQSKGIYVTPPYVDIPANVDYINDKNDFFNGASTEKRPLSVQELRQLFMNLQANSIGEALMQGFSQVVVSKEINKYIQKGKELSTKYLNKFCNIFSEEGLSLPPSYLQEVLPISQNESPFSDRLMLNHILILNSYGIGNYALGMAQSQRRDLTKMYGKFILDVGSYADKGAEILIKNKWLEQPPLIPSNEQ